MLKIINVKKSGIMPLNFKSIIDVLAKGGAGGGAS